MIVELIIKRDSASVPDSPGKWLAGDVIRVRPPGGPWPEGRARRTLELVRVDLDQAELDRLVETDTDAEGRLKARRKRRIKRERLLATRTAPNGALEVTQSSVRSAVETRPAVTQRLQVVAGPSKQLSRPQ